MDKAQQTPIFLALIAAFLGAWAQYFYKNAAMKFSQVPIYQNVELFLGLISFTLVLVLFIFAFQLGGKMFVVYPVYATTYIWGGLISHYILKESISMYQVLGAAFIILGVGFVSLSPQH